MSKVEEIRERLERGYTQSIYGNSSLLIEQMYDDIESLLILFDALDRSRKPNSVAFAVFLRENYSTLERWEGIQLPTNIWREYKTENEFTIEELYNKFIESYDKKSN
jgi:hypothetical protein